jgi:integrase
MAIEKITQKSGTVFRSIWINPLTKKKESKSFDNALDAQEYDLKMKRRIKESPQSFAERDEEILLFSDVAWIYFKMSQMSEKNKYINITTFKSTIFPVLKDVVASEITKKDMSKLKLHCIERGNKANTIKRIVGLVKAIMNWAVEEGILEFNPIAKYIVKGEPHEAIKPPTTEERDLIWTHAADHIKRAIIISTGVGLRVGNSELLDVQWSDVDFTEGTLTVRSAKKNKNMQIRVIELNPSMISIMKEWHQADLESGVEYLIHFHNKRVKCIHEAWTTAKLRAGITRRIRPYDMRHYFVTEALKAGSDLKAVAEIIGHSNPTMILKHYQHTVIEQKKFAVQAIKMPMAIPNGNNHGNNGGK